MAQLLIAAAVNIAIGLLINELFPPPDIEQEGPRLTELGFTSAAYGKMVNVVFGTDRIAGNIIDTTDPAIEEVVTKESQEAGGKGGGQTVNTTTYTYFLTARLAWCIEGAADIIRWWGDGKIILDATGDAGTPLIKEGVTYTFYPGGQDQIQDPEEVTRRGSDIPAYGHLTTMKIDRMPLADFGNRIPNMTAEIAFASSTSTPVLNTVEPSGFNPPGSLTGADVTYMSFNPDRNELYGLKGGSLGTYAIDASSMVFKSPIGGGGFSSPAVGRDGFAYTGTGSDNSSPMQQIDIETGEVVQSFGVSGLGLLDTFDNYGNAGQHWQLSTTIPGVGVKSTVFHLNTSFPAGGPPNGNVTDPDLMSLPAPITTPIIHVITTADGLVDDGGPLSGTGIPDHDRGRFFIWQDDDLNGEYRLVKYTPVFSIGVNGAQLASLDTELVRVFTRGTFAAGDDFQGSGNPAGWAVNRTNGNLILSNNSCVVLYNPDTDTILAQNAIGGMQGRNNYYNGGIFAWGISDANNGTIRVIDTRSLEIIRDIKTDDIPWPSGVDGVIHEQSNVWDDRVQALFLSRVDLGSNAAIDFRVLKVFVNRLNALGVGLDSVVSALSTTYQRQKMAGLLPSDINVTTLAGDNVPGYSLTRQSTMKSALQPLRDRYLFDAHQSDWIIKFPKRGAASQLTIPEEDVGILKRGRTMTDEPAVREIRQDDLSLPMSLAVRYKNKDSDYQIDIERDKRHLFPNPTMRSKSERTLDIPIVETSTNMKQLAQKTLLTLWNERVSYKTIVPWTYLKLDATDVFSMGVFNETHQLRMAENDLGLGWAIELTGVVEDTKSFASTIAGGTHSGHVGTVVPSGLPTRLFPLDAPLLSLQDLLLTPISNAYMAVGAFEAGWPGASILKSLDNVAYNTTGTVNEETAMARVRTAPGAWNRVDGDFPNRWQETTHGGTMVVTPLRRPDEWTTTTELLLLAGANTVAVIRESDKQVEILSFQNAVLNDDNTVTLTRLLRGRLGTEDIADLGVSIGDTAILLSDAANVKDSGPILRQKLTLSELDTVTFFKGVTVGTLIENAPVISATYTGRDIKPYFPADIRGVSDGFGGLDVSWARRTRGPLAGEWLDGTGTVVLNETIEQYEVTLSNLGGDFLTKVVNDAEFVNFSAAEIALGGTSGGVTKQFWPIAGAGIVSGDQEGGTINSTDQPLIQGNWVNLNSPTGWQYRTSLGAISGPPVDARITPASTNFMAHNNNSSDSLREVGNTIDLVADLGMASVDIPISTVRMSVWFATGRDSDEGRIWIDVQNSAFSTLASTGHNNIQANPGTDSVNIGDWIHVGSIYDGTSDPWVNRPLQIALSQPGASKLRLRFAIEKGGTTFSTGITGYDHVEIEVLAPPPNITVKVVQVSDTGLKSPIAFKQVT